MPVCLSVCACVCVCLSLCVCVSVCVCVCLSVSTSLRLYVSLSVSTSLRLYVSLSVSLPVSGCVSGCVCLCLCLLVCLPARCVCESRVGARGVEAVGMPAAGRGASRGKSGSCKKRIFSRVCKVVALALRTQHCGWRWRWQLRVQSKATRKRLLFGPCRARPSPPIASCKCRL